LRRVAARYVTTEILERPKEGFVLPKNTWLRAGMSGLLNEVLSPERLSIHGFFKPESIASLIAAFRQGDDALTFRIWTLLVFQLWYEDYLADELSRPDAYAIPEVVQPASYENLA